MAKTRYGGEDILTDNVLANYLRFKPLQYALEVGKIKDDNYKTVSKSMKDIEGHIKVGDMYLYRVRQTIANNFKYGQYEGILRNIKDSYGVDIKSEVVCKHILSKIR